MREQRIQSPKKCLCTWLGECCRLFEAEEVSNSRNKIHQTTYKDFFRLCMKSHSFCENVKIPCLARILHGSGASSQLLLFPSLPLISQVRSIQQRAGASALSIFGEMSPFFALYFRVVGSKLSQIRGFLSTSQEEEEEGERSL